MKKKIYGYGPYLGLSGKQEIIVTGKSLNKYCVNKVEDPGAPKKIKVGFGLACEHDDSAHFVDLGNEFFGECDGTAEFLQRICRDGTNQVNVYYTGIRIIDSALTAEALTLLRVCNGKLDKLYQMVMHDVVKA